MPAHPRRSLVFDDNVGVYHCRAKCVRQAYLCGVDDHGNNFEHRRKLLEWQMKRLAGVFAVDVLNHAVMSNHLHVILRTRPDLVDNWSDDEVARRWCAVCALARDLDGKFTAPREARVTRLLKNAKKLAKARKRLSNISWMMGKLCEWMARHANREDHTHGHFWEGRFRSDALLDEESILACGLYVDLNVVRARMAETPEASQFTSAYDRIRARQARLRAAMGEEVPAEELQADQWLCPLSLDRADATGRDPSDGRKGFLPMRLDEYLTLLDWTGRQLRADKRGAIPAHLAPILERLEVNADCWLDTVAHFGRWFRHCVGKPEHVEGVAKKQGKRWVQKLHRCRQAFSKPAVAAGT